MKIIVKTLKGQMIDLQVEATTTILSIKQKIKELKGFEVQSQKIVLKGKATVNQDTVQKLNIKEKDFLVVMATIKKPQPKKQQVPKNQQKKQEKPSQNQQVKPQTKPEYVTPKLVAYQPGMKAQTFGDGTNPDFEPKVNELMNMGFSREKCFQALQAAYGNSQRAVEYLLNGIPEVLPSPFQRQSPVNGLGGLLGTQQFEQVRELLRTNPQAIQPILEQLAQTSPQLYNLIAEHPEEFERLIMQGGEGEEEQVQDSMEPEGEQIVVTQAQQQAIERLSLLGFSKLEAAQAYLACDKNEQMAANLLFDRLANGDIEQGAFEQDFQDEGDDDNLFN